MLIRRLCVALVLLGLMALLKTSMITCDDEGKGARSTAEMNVQRIADVVSKYRRDHDGAVASWRDLLTPDRDGVRAVQRDTVPRDPWGHEYRIEADEAGQARIVSWGADGLPGTNDDIMSVSAHP